jgi:hypothetical protein
MTRPTTKATTMPTLERDTQRCSMQPDKDKQQCLKDRSPGDDKDRPLDDDDDTMAAWLELLEGDKDEDGSGKTGDVPAPERTKTEEGDDEESESDEEYVRSCKMMRLSLAHEHEGQLLLRAWTPSMKATPWWQTPDYQAAEKHYLWDKFDEMGRPGFVDFSCYLSQDYSKGMVAVADKAFRFVQDVTEGRDYKVRLRAYNYVFCCMVN